MKTLINHIVQIGNKITEPVKTLFAQSAFEISELVKLEDTLSLKPSGVDQPPSVKLRDILVHENLLQQMIDEKDPMNKSIRGYALLKSFERSLKGDQPHGTEEFNRFAGDDIDLCDAFDFVLNEIENPKQVTSKYFPLRTAMDRSIAEYLSTKPSLHPEQSLKIIQGLIDSHTIDKETYALLNAKSKIADEALVL